MKITDYAVTERPYEKCLEYGPGVLSDAELLAIFIRTGSKNLNAIQTANIILDAHPVHKGLAGLNFLSIKDLTKISGVGQVKAIQMMCISELSKRLSKASYKPFIQFDSPDTVADYFMEETRYLTKERVYALLFDSKHKLLKSLMISEGTVNQSLITPRELFIEALRYEAVYVILIHNHPSGDPSPSQADINLTDRVKDAGSIIGIELSDHIILGNNCYFSMAERSLL